ncbi:MAG: acyltransferase family protein [Clostridia bacterium]|nr:acyltransferase family protein [Clostridia bacterium]
MNDSVTSNRIQKWDILKAELIFLVILGHLVDVFTEEYAAARSIFIFIYTFHMPLFMFVSGLFSKRMIEQKRFDRIFGYFSVFVFDMLLRLLMYHGESSDLFSTTSAPWYMLAMIMCALMTMFFKRFSPAYVLCFAVVFACLLGYNTGEMELFAFSRSVVFFPFYFLGYICDREKLEAFCSGKIKKIVAAVLITVLAVVAFVFIDKVYWLRLLLTAHSPYEVLGAVSCRYGFFIRLAYYLVASVAGLCVIVLTPNSTKIKTVTRIGQRTLAIYVFQEIMWAAYLKLNIKGLLEYFFHGYAVWFTIPIAAVGVIVMSFGIFDKIVKKIYNVPMKKQSE